MMLSPDPAGCPPAAISSSSGNTSCLCDRNVYPFSLPVACSFDNVYNDIDSLVSSSDSGPKNRSHS